MALIAVSLSLETLRPVGCKNRGQMDKWTNDP